jgi:hypothetical protein
MRLPLLWWSIAVVLAVPVTRVEASVHQPAPRERVEPDPAQGRLGIAFSPDEVRFRASADGEAIELAGALFDALPPGAPDLPVIQLVVWVDDDFQAETVRVTNVEEVSLGTHQLRSVAVLGADGYGPRKPDPAYLASDRWFPAQQAVIGGESWLRGRRLVHLTVHPLRIRPTTGEVMLATRLQLEFEGRRGEPSGLRPRPVPWEGKVDASLGRTAVDLRRNPSPVAGPEAPVPPATWSPTFRPTTDGSAVEYVIVTSEAMADSFEVLADWKTRKGVQAVVRTIEWIEETYPNGVDRAEQLRFFLEDAYYNWGTLWVLLGGDTEVIPIRYAVHGFTNPPYPIPTDYYYSCINGNWNGDGDALFGEALPSGQQSGGDTIDLSPDLWVGRAPVSTAGQASIFIHKVIDYEKAVGLNSLYPTSVLLLGEQLSPSLDGALFCENVLPRLPAGFRTVRMYENYQSYPGALPELRNRVLDSLNTGFAIVHHVGHGFRTTMSVGSGTLNNADIDNLNNGPRQSVVYGINCASASIDFNAIGERFLKNSDGGGVAFIGSTRISFAGTEFLEMQNEFYELVFQDSVTAVGEALALSKVPFIDISESENIHRWLMFSIVLLGDPELPIWRRAPQAISATHAGTYMEGRGNYAVQANVAGVPLTGATVALVKTGDAFALGQTAAGGSAVVPFNPATTGSFKVTVTRPGYRPYESTATVADTAGPFVHVNQFTINDDATPPSMGNGDGNPDAGELVELWVTLKNSGGSPANGVSSTLSLLNPTPHVNILQNTVSYGTISPGGQSVGISAYLLELEASAPEAFQPLFQTAITSTQRSWTDTFVVPVTGVELEHYGHLLTDTSGNNNGIPEPGEPIVYRVTARNNGTARADAVGITMRVLRRSTMQPDPDVTVTDATASFGTILPDSIRTGDQLAFTLSNQAVVANLLVELSWSDSHGPRGVGLSDLVRPNPVSNLTAVGTASSIQLTWTGSSATDIRGHDIWRANSPPGPYVRVNNHTGVGSARFDDSNLPPLTRYYYYIVARDSSYNASVPSAVISATTSPPLASGWPIETGQETSSGVVIDDLDGDGDYELLTGSDAIYAWHHDGAELRDGDSNPLTSGVFTSDGQNASYGYHSTPAAADLTPDVGDHDLEIIGVAWRAAQVYVWNADGTREPGWPQAIGEDFNWASPAVEDLDLDGDREIVVVSGLDGKIYAWHHDGTEVADGDGNPNTSGVLFTSQTAFLYSSPAVGDIDGDLYPEIVFGTQAGTVFALRRTGAVMPGWPDSLGGQITASPALADLDGDGDQEVIISAESDSVFVLRGDGSRFTGWPRYADTNSDFGHTSSPVLADLSGDGNLEVIYAANNGQMKVWDRFGQPMPGWDSVLFAQDAQAEDATQATPSVADVDGDGFLEVILGAENQLIYGWNHDGTVLNGFPVSSGGQVRGSTALWDLDSDGHIELCAATNDRNVYVWDLSGEFRGDRIPWPFFRHDTRNTGRFDADPISIGVNDPGLAPAAASPILHPAYPNPFNPSTTIRFTVPGEAGGARPVRLKVFDVEGRLVRDLVDGPIETGEQMVLWDGRSARGDVAASGVYFVRLEVAGKTLTGKAIMLK